jgi:hypothetical protein
MVIDFSIENNPNIFGFIGQWLMPALNVDDAEAAHRESDVFVNETAVIVWTTVRNALGHSGERLAQNMAGSIREEDSANSTHRFLSPGIE